jgi:hypothetical protein
MSGQSLKSRVKQRLAIASTGALFVTPLLAASAAYAAPTQPLASTSSASEPSRTVTITGYAWCESGLGISIGAAVPCGSVTLDSDFGPEYHATVQPTQSLAVPLEAGRFTFTDVPVPALTDLSLMHYTVTAEGGPGLTDRKPVQCVHEDTIEGPFLSVWTDTIDLFWQGGPWTALPFSACSQPKPE